jgi:hypothetical protein
LHHGGCIGDTVNQTMLTAIDSATYGFVVYRIR